MMMEIIPNWHPIFVHFTIGLLGISALFYLAGSVLKRDHLLVVARWNLWTGALITVGTVLAGFYAYNTVNHDGPSHAAMTDHRNWALATATIFILLALWAWWKQRGSTASPAFIAIILLAAGMLAVTGYKGGEVVYRHGLGVMRMPEVSGKGHGHHGMPKPDSNQPLSKASHHDNSDGHHHSH